MTREALKKLNEKQMNYCKTLSVLIDRAKIKGLKEENERNRGKLRGFLECMEQMELLSGYEVKALYLYTSRKPYQSVICKYLSGRIRPVY